MSNDRTHKPTTDEAESLPPLPEQSGWCLNMHGSLVTFVSNSDKSIGLGPGCSAAVFTADQMRTYALQAIASAQQEVSELKGLLARQAKQLLAVEDAADALKAPAAEGWVSVNDEAIPTEGLLDLLVDGGRRYAGCYYDHVCDEWRLIDHWGKLFHVKRRWITYWMHAPKAPLPHPPKEKTAPPPYTPTCDHAWSDRDYGGDSYCRKCGARSQGSCQ